MRVAISALPNGVEAEVDGNRARVSYGDPEAPTVISVATDGTDLILFPDRAYKHADLVKVIGVEG